MEWAAGETWKGIEWCYNTAPCKAAAIKYGTMAVEDAMKAASLQELNWFSGAVHSVEHDVSTAAHAVEPIAKYAAGKTW